MLDAEDPHRTPLNGEQNAVDQLVCVLAGFAYPWFLEIRKRRSAA